MRLLTFLNLFVLLAFFIPANAQTNLTNLVNYTLEHSRDIKKAGYQYEESDYKYREVLGQGLPQVEASGSYSKMILPDLNISPEASTQINGILDLLINEGTSTEDAARIKGTVNGMLQQISNIDALYTASAAIQITQLIYSQSYWVGLKTAKKSRELYSILKEKSEEDVIAEVANGYYQAGSLMLQLRTVDQSIKNLDEMHRIAQLSYQNDLIKESQVNRLKVTIANLQVTRQTIENGISIQLNYLKALAGMPADSLLKIDTTQMINDFTRRGDASFAVENVPAYQALLKQSELYSQQVKLAKATFYPTLAAFGKLNYSSYNTEAKIGSMNNMNTYGLSLSMPIFSSGANYAKIKQSQLKQAQLNEDIAKTKDLLTVSYTNAYLEYQTAFSLLAAQKENRELAQKVYNQTSLQYQEGMASMSDLLNVNSDFLQADNSYNQQILKCKTAEIKMLQASGQLKTLIQ